MGSGEGAPALCCSVSHRMLLAHQPELLLLRDVGKLWRGWSSSEVGSDIHPSAARGYSSLRERTGGKSPPFSSEMMSSSTSHCSELSPGHINHTTHDRHTAGILLVADLGTAKVKGIPLTLLARCILSLYCETLSENLSLMADKLILNFGFKGL